MTVEPAPSIPILDQDPVLAVPPPREPVDVAEPAPEVAAEPVRFADPGHLHAQACYWDFRSAGWVCP